MKQPDSQLKWYALIAVLAFGVYANSLGGGFVYDDSRQILMNPLIQQPKLYAKALTSDVWAFKGDGSVSASNYYRPTFIGWLILNFSVFGATPFGWHLMNVVLHIAVCLLILIFVGRLGFSSTVSFVLAAIFAVHPVHVENVSWISGSPDILLSLFFVSSLLFWLKYFQDGELPYILLALLFYALALGTKEVAMLLFPLYYLVYTAAGKTEKGDGFGDRMLIAKVLPFAILSVLFFVIRLLVLGDITHPVEDAPPLTQAILSVPAVSLFYFRQSVVPIFLSENYPLRPLSTALSSEFLFSLIATAAVVIFVGRLCGRDQRRQLGALLFLLPLLPALFIGAFPSEQIVHDRYLYLSIAGLLIFTAPFAELAFSSANKYRRLASIISAIMIVLFSTQTVFYNRVWRSNFSLWEHSVNFDPSSASNWVQYAAELSGAEKYPEAIMAYNRSIEIKRSALALMGRARNYIALGRTDDAIDDASQIIRLPNEQANAFTLFQGYEVGAIAYLQAGRTEEAEKVVREALARLPIYRAALTDKLAIILYNQGKKQEALTALKSVREQARRELLPASKSVFFRLGMLEAELGDIEAARRNLTEFLDLTNTFSDPESLGLRRQAISTLQRSR
jgi:protein O-mannosyl-transferase